MDPSSASLVGRVAAVTGAGAGIGKGIARGFAAFGARVAVLERNAETAQRTADEIVAAGGEAMALPVDVRDGAAFARALDAIVARFGEVDVLVNNVGGTFVASFVDTSENGWNAVLRQNLGHVLNGTQLVARRLIAAERPGSIINVVSIEATRAAPSYAVYAAAKAGVVNFTQTIAVELAPHGIRVNALAPDICMTEGLAAMVNEAERDRWQYIVPLGRAGDPDDLAGPAIFLASDLSRYVTGVLLHVDGGTHASGGWYRSPEGDGWVLGPPRRR